MTLTADGFQLIKLTVLIAAIVAILVLNWHITKAFFTFRNRRPSHVLILVYGFLAISVALMLPFFAIAYLGMWVFDWLPSHAAGYLTVTAELVWMVPAFVMVLRNSAKYWKNRRPKRFF